MKKLATLIVSIALVFSAFSFAFAEGGTTKSDIPQTITDKKAELKNLFEKSKVIREKLTSTKGQVKEAAIALKDSLKNLSREEKVQAREEIKSAKAEVKSLRENAKVIIAEMRAQHESMKKYREQLKAEMSAKDYSKAEDTLNQMISLKTAKNTNLEKLLEIRNKILDALK